MTWEIDTKNTILLQSFFMFNRNHSSVLTTVTSAPTRSLRRDTHTVSEVMCRSQKRISDLLNKSKGSYSSEVPAEDSQQQTAKWWQVRGDHFLSWTKQQSHLHKTLASAHDRRSAGMGSSGTRVLWFFIHAFRFLKAHSLIDLSVSWNHSPSCIF